MAGLNMDMQSGGFPAGDTTAVQHVRLAGGGTAAAVVPATTHHRDDLLIGGQVRKGSGRWSLDEIYALFPILRERRRSPGTALSGGQQQMVAIGRALMSNPELLLCDEISLGLAPVVIRDIYAALPAIRATGAAVIIVEQDITRALSVADRVYCMMEGRITLTAPANAVTREAIHAAYFGAAA